MCYSGKCQYETWEGGCRVRSYAEYEKIVGFGSCFIGGGQCTCAEEEKIYNNNKQFYDSICDLTYAYGIIKI